MDDEVPSSGGSPHKRWTEDDLLRLTKALETTNGNRAHAAQILGIPVRRVENAITWHRDLKARWGATAGDKVPGTEASSEIHREDPVGQFSRDEKKAAAALTKQDKLLAQSFKKLNFTKEERDFLTTLQKSYATQLKQTIDLTYSGMIHTATRLLLLFEDLTAKIRAIDDNPEEYERIKPTKYGDLVVKSAHEYRCELYDRLISVSSELRKVNTDATRAHYVRAQLEMLKKGGSRGTGDKPEWPRGAPPSTVVNVRGEHVSVSSPDTSVTDVPASETK